MTMQNIHCIGIGGIGISAIARVLLEKGYRVTGCDLALSPVAEALAEQGVTVSAGHAPSHLDGVDAVLVSSAVPADNPELIEARRRGIPVFKRAAFLGQLMAGKVGVAVAGTHGKTTTTSMVAWILDVAQVDPTFIVGGVIEQLDTNARAGEGPHFVIEADEYDHMFLGLRPTVAAVTHLEHDHPDCFPTFGDMQDAFQRFLELVPEDGLIVGCADHPSVAELLASCPQPRVQTCGMGEKNDWHTLEVWPNPLGGFDFGVVYKGRDWGCARLRLPGLYNVQNALIAIAIADWLGIEQETVCRALASFVGTQRRFQVKGQVGGITVIDDYGHHPTEIAATLDGARARYRNRPLWAVFQPHTFSRTQTLWDAFLRCFDRAEHVVVLDIYPARETDTLGVSAADLTEAMHHPDAIHLGDFDAAADYIVNHAEPHAVVITFSAGDGSQVGEKVLERLS